MKPRYLFRDGRIIEEASLYHLLTDTKRQKCDQVVLLVICAIEPQDATQPEEDEHEQEA